MKTKNKILLLIVLILIFIMLPTKVSATSTIDVMISGTYDYSKAQEVLSLLNDYRRQNGLTPLTMDEELLNTAMYRAGEISLYFSHTRPNGGTCYTASSKMDGENIAMGFSTSSAVMNCWKNSSGHNKNLLGSDYKSIGIGCYRIGNTNYWVQCFSRDNATKGTATTGLSNITQGISILTNIYDIYAYPVINSGNSYMATGETGYLVYGVGSINYRNLFAIGQAKDFNFSSSDLTVIQVNSDGTFTAIGGGQATISVTLKNDSSKSYSVTINVQGEKFGERYLFNSTYYADRYSDLKAAFGYNEVALKNHWLNNGIREGRSASPVFDPVYYLNNNSDLRAAYGADYTQAYNHFITFGIKEGRRGSKYFDITYYLSHNSDVNNAFSGNRVLGLVHFINFGINEGRRGCNDFNVISYYNSQNAYTKRHLGKSYLKYYALADGGNPINNNPIDVTNYLFDSTYYADKYSDLKAAFGYNEAALRNHWLNNGIREGRSASPVFDPVYYLNNNSDLRAAFGTDYVLVYNHFISNGVHEGRQSSPTFNVSTYLSNYTDLQIEFGTNKSRALEHYMMYGRNEGRTSV